MRTILYTAIAALVACCSNLISLSAPLGCGVCFAQPAPGAGPVKPDDTAPKDLVFLAKVNETIGTQDLIKKMSGVFTKTAAKDAGLSCDLARIKPEEIDRDVAERLMQIIRPGLSQASLQGDIAIELETGGEKSLWTLYLKSLQHDLEELKITVPKGDDGTTEELTFTKSDIGKIGDTDKDIAARKPGVYIVSLPKGTEPKSYKAVVYDNSSDKSETYEGEWPQRQRQYIIRLYNFRGQLKDLERLLEDETVMAETITADFEDRPINLVTANFGQNYGELNGGWSENRYKVIFSQPKNRYPKRVWLQFPLSEADAETARKLFLQDSGVAKPGDEISHAIRAAGPKWAAKDGKPSDSGAPVYILEPTAKTQWHELPRMGTKENPFFAADFEVVDIDGWKNMLPEIGSWRLYAFEFDDGTPEVVSVMHPKTRREVRVISEFDQGWIGGLNRLEGSLPPKDAPPAPRAPPAGGGTPTGK